MSIPSKRAFTLIELLIVVAIIAILAAIAVPNFLESQTRSKIAREKADLRTLATALESYYIDWNSYTRDSDSSLDQADVGPSSGDMNSPDYGKCANGALQLTTPIAYLSNLLSDPFVTSVKVSGAGARGYRIGSGSWSYDDPPINTADNQDSHLTFKQMGPVGAWVAIGVGPDQNRCRMGYKNFPFMPASNAIEGPPGTNTNSKGQPYCYMEYDPTNGTTSVGDVYRFGGSYTEGRFMFNGQTIGRQNPIGGEVW